MKAEDLKCDFCARLSITRSCLEYWKLNLLSLKDVLHEIKKVDSIQALKSFWFSNLSEDQRKNLKIEKVTMRSVCDKQEEISLTEVKNLTHSFKHFPMDLQFSEDTFKDPHFTLSSYCTWQISDADLLKILRNYSFDTYIFSPISKESAPELTSDFISAVCQAKFNTVGLTFTCCKGNFLKMIESLRSVTQFKRMQLTFVVTEGSTWFQSHYNDALFHHLVVFQKENHYISNLSIEIFFPERNIDNSALNNQYKVF